MRELSMHILDLAQNSIVAQATRIEIEVSADTRSDRLLIAIRDNGLGMDGAFLARVKDPFATTRTTRRVGLGIPMLTEAAEACGGGLSIDSEPGQGTDVVATFQLRHIDRAPLGDMTATLIAIIAANPDIDLRYLQRADDEEFILDTKEIKAQLEGVPINEVPVLNWLREYVRQGTETLTTNY